MRKSAIILLALLFCFESAARNLVNEIDRAEQSKIQPQPIRAVQVNTLEFDNLNQLSDWLKNLKSAGVNTIIVRVFQNPGDGFHKICVPEAPGGVYFQTTSAPVVCDLVGILSQESHKAGLKFYAWMNTRSADYGWEARTDLHSWAYALESRRYEPQNRLCVFHPEVQERLINLYSDLAKNSIDGVLVQDDLMLKHNEDFHPLASHLYLKERQKVACPDLFFKVIESSGKKIVKDYTAEFWEWNDWKINKLLDLADELRKAVKKKKPGVKFGLNFYYETALKPEKGKAWFSQDLKKASERNYDFYALMLYHRQMSEELRITAEDLNSAIELASRNFLDMFSSSGSAVIKLMSKDFHNAEIIPEDELTSVIKCVPSSNRAGLIFFSTQPGQELELKNLIFIWEGKNNDQTNQRAFSESRPSSILQSPKP